MCVCVCVCCVCVCVLCVCVCVSRAASLYSSADESFLNEREHALGHFLSIICRHPTLRQDEALKFFVTFNGTVSWRREAGMWAFIILSF